MTGTLTLVSENDGQDRRCSSEVLRVTVFKPEEHEAEFLLDDSSALFRHVGQLMHSRAPLSLTFEWNDGENVHRLSRAYPSWMDRYEEPGMLGLFFEEHEIIDCEEYEVVDVAEAS